LTYIQGAYFTNGKIIDVFLEKTILIFVFQCNKNTDKNSITMALKFLYAKANIFLPSAT